MDNRINEGMMQAYQRTGNGPKPPMPDSSICEQCTMERGRAILTFLIDADDVVSEISGKLFGQKAQPEGGLPPAPISGLDAMLMNGSTRAACLLGALRTIAARLGE